MPSRRISIGSLFAALGIGLSLTTGATSAPYAMTVEQLISKESACEVTVSLTNASNQWLREIGGAIEGHQSDGGVERSETLHFLRVPPGKTLRQVAIVEATDCAQVATWRFHIRSCVGERGMLHPRDCVAYIWTAAPLEDVWGW